jgi:superfamily II DNA or RNA helicase
MNIEISNLESKLLTDNPKLLNALADLYTFEVKGARYTPQYRRGGWDGKKSFLSRRTGKFPTGMLPRILDRLAEIDCYPELNYDFVPEPDKVFEYSIPDWDYRDYQTKLIGRALTEKRCVIKAPTGAGKTLILAGLIQALQDKTILVLFNSISILEQTYRYLTLPHPDGVDFPNINKKSIGVAYGEGFEYGDVMLCSVFSLSKIIGTPHERADVLMVDEVHEFCTGKLTSGVISAFPLAQYRFGLTATPPKDPIKKYTLEGAIGPTISEVTTKNLVDSGELAKPIIHRTNIEFSEEVIDWSEDERTYMEVYERCIIHNQVRNERIEEICTTAPKGSKILVLVQRLDHAELLHELIEGSMLLQGKDNTVQRFATIKDFIKTKSTSVLIGTRILQTGVNIPEITHFINARGLKSEIPTIQALGRSMRKYKNTPEVQVYDFYDKVKYLSGHSRSRFKAYKEEKHEISKQVRTEYAS